MLLWSIWKRFGQYKWNSTSDSIDFFDKKKVMVFHAHMTNQFNEIKKSKLVVKYEDFVGIRLNGDVYANKYGSALETVGLIIDAFDPDINNAQYAMETRVINTRRIFFGFSVSVFYKENGKTVQKEIKIRESGVNKYNYRVISKQYVKMVDWINDHVKSVL